MIWHLHCCLCFLFLLSCSPQSRHLGHHSFLQTHEAHTVYFMAFDFTEHAACSAILPDLHLSWFFLLLLLYKSHILKSSLNIIVWKNFECPITPIPSVLHFSVVVKLYLSSWKCSISEVPIINHLISLFLSSKMVYSYVVYVQ